MSRSLARSGVEHRGGQTTTLDTGVEAEWIERIEKIDNGKIKSAVRKVSRAERRQAGQTRTIAERAKEYQRYGGRDGRLFDEKAEKFIEDEEVNRALAGPLFLELWPPGRLYSGRRWCFSLDELDPKLKSLGLEFTSLSIRVERIVKDPNTGLETAHIRGELYAGLPYQGDYADLEARVEIDLPIALGVPFRTEIVGSYSGKGRADLDPVPSITAEYRFRQTMSPGKALLAELRSPVAVKRKPRPEPKEQRSFNPKATARLAAAVQKGEISSVHLLLKIGADPGVSNEQDCPVLYDALLYPDEELREVLTNNLLGKGASANVTCAAHGPPLLLALKKELRGFFIEKLVGAGAEVNARDEQGRTPLMLAMERFSDQTEVVTTLLRAGADPNLADHKGDSALAYAVSDGNQETILLLIEWGADMDAPNRAGLPPLLVAAQRWHDGNSGWKRYEQQKKQAQARGQMDPALPDELGRGTRELDALRQLLRAGADLDAALRAAEPESDAHRRLLAVGLRERIKCGALEQVQSLLQQGADVHARWDGEFQCPLLEDAASSWGDPIEMTNLLLQAGAPVNLPCHSEPILVSRGGTAPPAVIEQLLRHGAKVNAQSKDGSTALMKVLSRNDPEEEFQVVEMLLTAGADVRLRKEDQETVLHQAAIAAHFKTLEHLISAGAQVDAKDDSGRTPLMIALNMKKKANAEVLLRTGANINVRNKSGETPFHEAAEGGNVELLEQLLAAGADIRARDSQGKTPLMSAAAWGRVAAMDWLLKQGVDVNAADSNKKTALHLVADLIDWDYQQGKLAVRILLTAGAEIDRQDAEGVTALMKMAERGHAEGAEMLLDAGANPHLRDKLGQSALNFAAWGWGSDGNANAKRLKAKGAIAHDLLRAGADPNVRGKWDMTPLIAAADHPDERLAILLMEELLKYGANPELLDMNKKLAWERLRNPLSALRTAKSWQCPRVVALLENRIQDATASPEIPKSRHSGPPAWDVEEKDAVGRTRLIQAAGAGYPAAVDYFLARRADVNATDNKSVTALMLAAMHGHHKVAKLLLSRGATPDMRLDSGLTALILASIKGHDTAVDVLLSSGAQVDLKDGEGRSPLFNSALYRHRKVVKRLLEHGADPNLVDNNGFTPLMAAAKEGDAETARLLLARGADINAEVNEGITAAAIARIEQHPEVQEVLEVALLEGHPPDPSTPSAGENNRQADPAARDERGRTHLMRAAGAGYSAAVNYYLTHGADANATDNNGVTALMLAANNGYDEAAKMLLSHGAAPNKRLASGLTALILAAQEGHDGVVDLLLNDKARVDLLDGDNRSALFNAVVYRHPKVVKRLLEAGADPNLVDNNGFTPLMAAAMEGDAEVARLLVAAGADIHAADEDGLSATDIARAKEYAEVLQVLQQVQKR